MSHWRRPDSLHSGMARAGRVQERERAGRSATQPTCGEVYATWTPELQAETGPCVLDSALWGELIGKVGVDGTPSRVGAATSMTPPATGVLLFTIGELENTYSDNSGAFTVLFK